MMWMRRFELQDLPGLVSDQALGELKNGIWAVDYFEKCYDPAPCFFLNLQEAKGQPKCYCTVIQLVSVVFMY